MCGEGEQRCDVLEVLRVAEHTLKKPCRRCTVEVIPGASEADDHVPIAERLESVDQAVLPASGQQGVQVRGGVVRSRCG